MAYVPRREPLGPALVERCLAVVIAIVGVALVCGAVGVAHVLTSRRIMALAALGGAAWGG
ncbi:MAG: hypothetical protein FJW09_01945 [Actinobacteria bacterium]|nr:hypothetical protein [Actinomycetota bacterium]